jgi:hypothetical protein
VRQGAAHVSSYRLLLVVALMILVDGCEAVFNSQSVKRCYCLSLLLENSTCVVWPACWIACWLSAPGGGGGGFTPEEEGSPLRRRVHP